MSLQARLQLLEPVESWSSLHNAALERYWDGIELATSPDARRTASVYMFGYVAEMLLKVAFFRVIGYPAGQAVNLGAIKTHAAWTRVNLHDLSGLSDLLIEERRLRNQPFSTLFASQLKACVMNIASHWRETLRYRHTVADETELADVFRNVDWLLKNANLLWS